MEYLITKKKLNEKVANTIIDMSIMNTDRDKHRNKMISYYKSHMKSLYILIYIYTIHYYFFLLFFLIITDYIIFILL